MKNRIKASVTNLLRSIEDKNTNVVAKGVVTGVYEGIEDKEMIHYRFPKEGVTSIEYYDGSHDRKICK